MDVVELGQHRQPQSRRSVGSVCIARRTRARAVSRGAATSPATSLVTHDGQEYKQERRQHGERDHALSDLKTPPGEGRSRSSSAASRRPSPVKR